MIIILRTVKENTSGMTAGWGGLQTIIRNSIEKLHDVGDITEQESDEIFSAAYNLFKYSLNADAYLITALTAWYNEVYNQLKNGKDGNFVSTLPLVLIEPGINSIVGSCLNLLPWHKKYIAQDYPPEFYQSAGCRGSQRVDYRIRLTWRKE